MKPEQTSSTLSAAETAAAAAYIAAQLPKARQALKRTRIIGLVLIGLVGSYISFISVTLVRFFQPREAAQIASGMVVQHIASAGPSLAVQIEREIPLLIRQLPDYVIRELPGYRREVEAVPRSGTQNPLRRPWQASGQPVGRANHRPPGRTEDPAGTPQRSRAAPKSPPRSGPDGHRLPRRRCRWQVCAASRSTTWPPA